MLIKDAEQLYNKWADHSKSMGGKPKAWNDLPEVQQRAWKLLHKDITKEYRPC